MTSANKLVKITDTAIQGDILYLNNEDGQASARIVVLLSSIVGWVESGHLDPPQTEILLNGGHVIRVIVDESNIEEDEWPLVDLNVELFNHFSPAHLRIQPGD